MNSSISQLLFRKIFVILENAEWLSFLFEREFVFMKFGKLSINSKKKILCIYNIIMYHQSMYYMRSATILQVFPDKTVFKQIFIQGRGLLTRLLVSRGMQE